MQRKQTHGEKLFELTNHLGNVLATITDKKLSEADGSGTLSYYRADTVSATDYYPFEMQMPGRSIGLESNHGFKG